MRLRPAFPSIEGLALQGLTSIIRIVVANLNDQPVPSLYRMKFVIVPVIISLPGWNIRKPLPAETIVARLTDANLLFFSPQSLSRIEETPVS
jgi:hypothetical protein